MNTDIVKTIQEKLQQIEQANDVQILFAVESGSRAWGFESKDSDYDVRFVYSHTQDWYLSVLPKRDVIEIPIDGVLDINGWDVRKALGLYGKTNPPFLEWLKSPITYIENTDFRKELRMLENGVFSPQSCMLHYLSMAKTNYNTELLKDSVKYKKYFYALRPIFACKWIVEKKTSPPIKFDELLDAILPEGDIRTEITKLLDIKKASNEIDEGRPIKQLNDYIRQQIAYYQYLTPKQPGKISKEKVDLDELFRKYIYKK